MLQGFKYPLLVEDLILIKRCIRAGWDVSPENRQALVDIVRRSAMESDRPRVVRHAVDALRMMEEANHGK